MRAVSASIVQPACGLFQLAVAVVAPLAGGCSSNDGLVILRSTLYESLWGNRGKRRVVIFLGSVIAIVAVSSSQAVGPRGRHMCGEGSSLVLSLRDIAVRNGADGSLRSGSQTRQNAALPVRGSKGLGRRGLGRVRGEKRPFRKHIGAEHDGSAVSTARNRTVLQKLSVQNGGGAAQTRRQQLTQVSFEMRPPVAIFLPGALREPTTM